MDANDFAVAADLNLATTWATLGRHAGFVVSELDTLTLVGSGLPIAFFNGAYLRSAPADASSMVGAAVAFHAAHGKPYLLWVRDQLAPAVVAAAVAVGLRETSGPPLMVLANIDDLPAPPPVLELRIGTSLEDLEAHRAVLAASFGIPRHMGDRVIAPSVLDDSDLAIAVGRVDGEAVVTALLSKTGPLAGVYNVATLPEHRGKGYGAAATWAVVAEGAKRGCTCSILQASNAGYPVYRRMGYVDVARYVQLAGPPASTL